MTHDPKGPQPHAGTPPAADVGGPAQVSPEEFRAVQGSAEFQRLRSSFRTFAFPMTAAFLVWYLAYVLLSTYAEGLMSTPVVGNLNLGLLVGLGQFLSTFLITWAYVRHANRSLDPVASRLRAELEGEA